MAGLAELDQPPPAAALVVAPHPDDETLAVGGTLSTWAAAGTHVQVVAVTDGEGSHPGRPGLAAERATEQRRALTALGVTTEPVRLGLPDTGVGGHHQELVDALVGLAAGLAEDHRRSNTATPVDGRLSDVVVVAPWDGDAHCDHDACGQAAMQAARRTGAALLAYPGWAWQWATPADFESLVMHRHRLDPEARRRKAEAVTAFTSQTTALDGDPPILSEQFLERFARPDEVIIVVDGHA